MQNSPTWGVLSFKKMLKEEIFCEGNFSLKSSKGAPKLLGGEFICDERQLESKPVYENGKLKDSAVVKIKSPLSHAR